MRPKYLFLLKFLGLSILLFIFGHQLLHAYACVMELGMKLLNPNYHIIPARAEEFLYGSSMTIIAFIALMLATPDVTLPKRVAALFVGLIAFLLTDWLFIQYVIFPQGQPVSNEDSPVFEIYLCIKWLLPFLLWIIMSYSYMEDLFSPQKETRGATPRKTETEN